MNDAIPDGWYPDPQDSTKTRYWRRGAWTVHVNDASGATDSVPAPFVGRSTPSPTGMLSTGTTTQTTLVEESLATQGFREDPRTLDEPTSLKTLHALRALGIFFIRSALAVLVSGAVAAIGFIVLATTPTTTNALSRDSASAQSGFGIALIITGLVVLIVCEIFVVIRANEELKKSD